MKICVKQAIGCSIAAFALIYGASCAFPRLTSSAYGLGEGVGWLLTIIVVADVFCCRMAAKSASAWSWPKFVGVYALTCIVLLAFAAPVHGAEIFHASDAAALFTVQWPAQWKVQHLDGLSSDPRDRDLGIRERGVLGRVKFPRAVIEVGGVYMAFDKLVTLADEFGQIIRAISNGYEADDFEVTLSEPFISHIGAYAALGTIIKASRHDTELFHSLSIAQNATRLWITSLSTTSKTEYFANLDTYINVKLSLRQNHEDGEDSNANGNNTILSKSPSRAVLSNIRELDLWLTSSSTVGAD